MKKTLYISLLSLLCVMFCAPVMAQIYKYETESGQVFYTNDYNQVPKEYRDQITGYDEAPLKNNRVSDNNGDDDTEPVAATTNPDLEARRNELENTRQDLAQTYQALNSRKQALEEQRAATDPSDAQTLTEINAEVGELNREIEEYSRRSSEYEQSVRDFNNILLEMNP